MFHRGFGQRIANFDHALLKLMLGLDRDQPGVFEATHRFLEEDPDPMSFSALSYPGEERPFVNGVNGWIGDFA